MMKCNAAITARTSLESENQESINCILDARFYAPNFWEGEKKNSRTEVGRRSVLGNLIELGGAKKKKVLMSARCASNGLEWIKSRSGCDYFVRMRTSICPVFNFVISSPTSILSLIAVCVCAARGGLEKCD